MKKVFLIILDGFGLGPPDAGNAIAAAGTPYLDSLVATYPAMPLVASGLAVGLPWGHPGNSEVGHSAIGTGRIIVQDLARINSEIRSGDFYRNPALREAIDHAKRNNSTLHLIGCTSAGGIHSHTDHLIALLDFATQARLERVAIHCIADGQDMPPQDAINVIRTLEPYCKKARASIASVQGRGFAMDRLNNVALTDQVWHAMALGDAPAIEDPADYLTKAYGQGLTDYDVEPATVTMDGRAVAPLVEGDAVIFYDFRNDRMRQLASVYLSRSPKNVKVITMTKYAEEFTCPIAYSPISVPNTLGEIIAAQGWKQWRVAEKEKEAHVTNFFNGGRILPFEGEGRDIVSSQMMKGREYIGHPEMGIERIIQSVAQKRQDDATLSVINIANPDMIGHAGNLAAAIRAIQITDDALKQIIEPIRQQGHHVLITADHGNAEELIDPLTGQGDTRHSTRTVPFICIGAGYEKGVATTLADLVNLQPIGTLVDIAPTVLKLLALPAPSEMTGSSLL